ncbi:flagellar hook assembly protein FlgD [Accumulibacter sp.]|uniref:flagellar hook assembly protein FlgD n=1 Tax=Accumulibacter sp. TaxID=2053492 RepID=UPI0025D3EC8E|nr:flagellar hook assembly protein FlgD [Accumulibacter sp.]MCM8596238.1 flagellar hook assembly protein FlgD [Accumulibacter sp.]MCM8627169.1 flagellar hook assembly protein FlgD [Accumulibacter sp.]MDS4050387.1 flagellar hook assembly protein FlgD [Accumulibacter sp.]
MTPLQLGSVVGSAFAALGSRTTNTATEATPASEEVQDRFLKLLVTQLKNQDPLNPLDNAAVTSQLSQISTVAGVEKLNTTLETLLNSYHDDQAAQAAALIGRQVLVPGSHLTLSRGTALAGVSLGEAADSVAIQIVDPSGRVVQSRTLGPCNAGSFSFIWDGMTDSGSAAPPGTYSFAVAALRDGQRVDAQTLQPGTVGGVVRSKGGFELDLGALGRVGFDKVQQIL